MRRGRSERRLFAGRLGRRFAPFVGFGLRLRFSGVTAVGHVRGSDARNGKGKEWDRNSLFRTIPFWNLLWGNLGGKSPYGKISLHVRIQNSLSAAARKREAAGLTQVEMAERLDETQSYVSKCERGDRRVDLVQLRRFCRAMGLSLSEFVGEFERQTGKGKR